MTQIKSTSNLKNWSNSEKIFFRFFFIYFIIQAVPLDWKFYRELFSINWVELHYSDIFNIAHYTPQFFEGQTYANWVVIAVISALGTGIWTALDKKNHNYDVLYYALRVILRYRLAIALFAYGFIKFFPLQSPYPSISNLNTSYGYFTQWKIFSLSLGIVPSYESFLGLLEIGFAILLLFRRTVTIGAFAIFAFAGNVFISNLAYEGGEHVYSLYLLSVAAFLLAFDTRRLLNVLSFERPTAPNLYNPSYEEQKLKYGRWGLQAFVLFFFVFLYGAKTYAAYKNDPYQFPKTPGLANSSGLYNVSEFIINNDTLKYSATDPIRWKDVVFEKWATISIRSNRPVIVDSNNVERIHIEDKDRTYELEGTGERHYYSYQADTVNHVLTLENKNKHYKGEKLVLKYDKVGDSTFILRGINENKDSIQVVLNKIHKKYVLKEVAKQGRRKPLKL